MPFIACMADSAACLHAFLDDLEISWVADAGQASGCLVVSSCLCCTMLQLAWSCNPLNL